MARYTVEEVVEAIDRAISELRSSDYPIRPIIGSIMDGLEWIRDELEDAAERIETLSIEPTPESVELALKIVYDVYELFKENADYELVQEILEWSNPISFVYEWLVRGYPELEVLIDLSEEPLVSEWEIDLEHSIYVVHEAQKVVDEVLLGLTDIIDYLERLLEQEVRASDFVEVARQLRMLASLYERVENEFEDTVRDLQAGFIGLLKDVKELILEEGLPEEE